MLVKKETYGVRKTILIGQDSYYIALPIRVSGSANATVKAGEPMTGNIATRLSTEFSAGTSSAVGVLLHDVVLDENGKGNGALVVVGCIDKLKIDSAVLGRITTAQSTGLKQIVVTEGSAI